MPPKASAATQPPAPTSAGAGLGNPHADLRNNPTGDLAELMSSFPGQAQDPAALARQGDRFFAEQRFNLAAQRYRQAIDAGSRAANDYNSLALTLHYLGRSAQALQATTAPASSARGRSRWSTSATTPRM